MLFVLQLIILTKLREKYTLGIITSEVNTIQSVKEIPQKKKKQSKVYVADKEENAEKEEPEEEKVQGRKSKRLKKAEC
jgi:nitrous oxide reductase accessory protein NosL